MTDLDLLVAGAMVTFIAVSAAYVAIRHRANDDPVESYRPLTDATPHTVGLAPAPVATHGVRVSPHVKTR